MDTITQALLGATIAEAGFRERLGGKAVAFGALCGVLPDFDVITRVGGEWASLVHHRGASHSLLVLPLVAPLVGYAGMRLFNGTRSDRSAWIHLAFWALVTHPLLDVFTTYGTQLLAPLSRQRFAIDGVAIIDPIYSVPLAVTIYLARYGRDRPRSRRVARAALVFTTVYLFAGFGLTQVVKGRAAEQLTAEGFRPAAMRTLVPIAFPLLRRVVARDEKDTLRVGAWSPAIDEIAFTELSTPNDPLIARALSSEQGQIFAWFADGFLHGTIQKAEAGVARVELVDQRYGLYEDPTASLFRARFLFRGGRMIAADRGRRPNIDLGAELAAGFSLLIGARPK